MPIETIY